MQHNDFLALNLLTKEELISIIYALLLKEAKTTQLPVPKETTHGN